MGLNTGASVDRLEVEMPMAWVKLMGSEVVKTGARLGLVGKLEMFIVFLVGVFVMKLFFLGRLGHSLLT